jgi:hypothetical protein
VQVGTVAVYNDVEKLIDVKVLNRSRRTGTFFGRFLGLLLADRSGRATRRCVARGHALTWLIGRRIVA